MSINKEVLAALKDIGIPVSFQTAKGKTYPYITFFTYLDRTMQHADDGEVITGYFIQVDIWSKTDYTSIEESIHQAMVSSGFMKQRFHDLYEDDTKVYHKVMRFLKEVEK
ncbi:MAG TPA: hypothetical protein VFC79_03825 [Tissierellaceae bacterium]|nr:hypothetical protein [Tissierellaceae bacterium]